MYLKLMIYNQMGREIVKGSFCAEQFSKFLGFLKAKAKFQNKIPQILEVPSSDFSIETVQQAFKILGESKIHLQENFL